jgi:hypothetical protein
MEIGDQPDVRPAVPVAAERDDDPAAGRAIETGDQRAGRCTGAR